MKEHVEIPDPIYGRIDMSAVQHVLHSPPLQRMAQIKQLGGAYFVFPSATHTRLSHMIGTAHITQLRTQWLRDNREELSGREARTCVIAAIVHDVGHWSFSHLLEPLCGNHDQRGLEIILGELAPYIRKCGVIEDDVARLMQREDKVSDLIFTNPIGADKLDYLRRDAYFSIGDGNRLDDLFAAHIRWDRKNGLYVLPKGIPLTQKAIELYWYLYTEVYERVSVRVAQRYIQELLRQMIELDSVVKDRLYDGGEDGVIGAIGYWCAGKGIDHECVERYTRFEERDYPKKALIFSPFPDLSPLRNKPTLKKIECDAALVQASEAWSIEKVAEIERQMASVIGAEHSQVTLAVSPPARRWKVPEVRVETADGIRLMGDISPGLHAIAADKAKMACTIAIAVDVKLRQKVVADQKLQQDIQEILATA